MGFVWSSMRYFWSDHHLGILHDGKLKDHYTSDSKYSRRTQSRRPIATNDGKGFLMPDCAHAQSESSWGRRRLSDHRWVSFRVPSRRWGLEAAKVLLLELIQIMIPINAIGDLIIHRCSADLLTRALCVIKAGCKLHCFDWESWGKFTVHGIRVMYISFKFT